MTPTEIRNTVRALQAQRHSLREISRILALSRNTVRRILRQPERSVAEAAACAHAGHFLLLEQPEAVARAVSEFLKGSLP